MRYEPNWQSLDARPIPPWFDESKLGIFIHWGLYSVPAWAPKGNYAEWYWASMADKSGETWKFHVEQFGEAFKYQDFVADFNAELFDPEQWAELFARSGARYVIPTAKHHDGFCLWPSAHAWNWNSVDVGPHRDIIGELATAVRAQGLRMALYYSVYEWFHPWFLNDVDRYVVEHMHPQLKDLVMRYEPSLIFTDGEWDKPSEVWRSCEFLTWLFNEAPNRDEVVVNDRWGAETRSAHGGYFTTEYGEVGGGKPLTEGRKWEENRGLGHSFGFNRNEDLADYMTPEATIHLLINTVSRGGNLNLNVGPTADGRIPVIMQERLLQLGEWLGVNGEAIFGTRPWRMQAQGDVVRYTSTSAAVYAICLRWPGQELALDGVRVAECAEVTLLGHKQPLAWRADESGLTVQMPPLTVGQMPCEHAYVVKLTGVA